MAAEAAARRHLALEFMVIWFPRDPCVISFLFWVCCTTAYVLYSSGALFEKKRRCVCFCFFGHNKLTKKILVLSDSNHLRLNPTQLHNQQQFNKMYNDSTTTNHTIFLVFLANSRFS